MSDAAALRASVAVPVLNEERGIAECLHRLTAQTEHHIEILVADGGSTDETVSIVRERAGEDPRIRLLDNPRRLQSAGLNICLAQARAPVLVRMDGHAYVEPDYVSRCLETMERSGAAVVGGRMVPQPGPGSTPRGIAVANESWWGAGPARFHRHAPAGEAETVYLGAFRVDIARALGGWSEDVGVNEDFEFNHRVRASGERVWFDPRIEVTYEPRDSLALVAKQYFRYGRSKATVMQRHRSSVLPRQLAPLVLAPALVAAFAAPRSVRRLARRGLLAHSFAVAAGAMTAREPGDVRIAAFAAAALMHHAWSAGVWYGLVRPFSDAATHGA